MLGDTHDSAEDSIGRRDFVRNAVAVAAAAVAAPALASSPLAAQTPAPTLRIEPMKVGVVGIDLVAEQ